jgi:hypothetical protein
MQLKANDLHFIFDGARHIIKCFGASGKERWRCECRNETTAAGAASRFFGYRGHCPPGEFRFGTPRHLDPPQIPFGEWFIDILDLEANGPMATYSRSEIGAHGGGSGLRNPFAHRQGWQVTHGCLRLQNGDMERLTNSVRYCQAKGGIAYITVIWTDPNALAKMFDRLGKIWPRR